MGGGNIMAETLCSSTTSHILQNSEFVYTKQMDWFSFSLAYKEQVRDKLKLPDLKQLRDEYLASNLWCTYCKGDFYKKCISIKFPVIWLMNCEKTESHSVKHKAVFLKNCSHWSGTVITDFLFLTFFLYFFLLWEITAQKSSYLSYNIYLYICENAWYLPIPLFHRLSKWNVNFNKSSFGIYFGFYFWQDGKASIVSWMLMSASPTPAYMVSVFRKSPALVIPVFASQDLWWDAEILSYLSFYLAIQHCTENTVYK